jgi:hypothetical protein
MTPYHTITHLKQRRANFSHLLPLKEAEKINPSLINNPVWQNYTQISWFLFFATAALTIVAGIMLSRVYKKKSVQFTIIALWTSGLGYGIFQMAAAYFTLGSTNFSGAIGPLLITILSTTIWHLYLLKSVRIKNTYN